SNCTYPIVRDHAATAWTAQNTAKLEVFAQQSDDSHYCPFYLDEDVKFMADRVNAYIVTKYVQEGDRLNLHYVKLEDGIIPANTPVLLNTASSGGGIDIERLPAGSAQPVKVKNFLTGTLKETYLSSVSGKTFYKYVEAPDREFAPLASNYRANRVNPGTCYLEIPEVIPGTVTYAKMISTDPTGGQPLAGNGDVNGDGVVDITDVNILLNIVLGKDSASKYPGADVNGDGTVDITDVNTVLNIVLGK
ncbi:MAG: dockerin type I repeat-containing protein, partial [Muribaculaceae bacterium]|nr:dockerin type I repeat-containing protein [Muribaculaceae bacterium]